MYDGNGDYRRRRSEGRVRERVDHDCDGLRPLRPTSTHPHKTNQPNMSGSGQREDEDGDGWITLYYGGSVPSKYGWGVEGREQLLARHSTADPPTFALLFGGPIEKKDAFREHIVRITDQWKRVNEGCYARLE